MSEMSILKEKGRFYTKEKDITMNIIFEKFTEKHIDEAVTLALAELQVEKNYCTNLPNEDFRKHLTNILQWLSSQQFGKAAISEGKLVGYLIFAGPWDGFFGDVKGVFSPLGGSAFSYDYENRGKLASMLFARVAKEFVKQNVFSCALSRYAHDEKTAKSFVLNGFGIRCSDAIGKISELNVQNNLCDVDFKELTKENFFKVEHLQKGLHKHLAGAPIFFPGENFENWFKNWIKRETMRIFAAETKGKIIGFISIVDDGENFITGHKKMKNICGAYFDKDFRGKGIAQNLLSFVINRLKTEETTHLGVDYETLNPTALNFWGKYFEPYTYSFARRIDERI